MTTATTDTGQTYSKLAWLIAGCCAGAGLIHLCDDRRAQRGRRHRPRRVRHHRRRSAGAGRGAAHRAGLPDDGDGSRSPSTSGPRPCGRGAGPPASRSTPTTGSPRRSAASTSRPSSSRRSPITPRGRAPHRPGAPPAPVARGGHRRGRRGGHRHRGRRDPRVVVHDHDGRRRRRRRTGGERGWRRTRPQPRRRRQGHAHGGSNEAHAAEMLAIDRARCDLGFNPKAYWEETRAMNVDTYGGGAMTMPRSAPRPRSPGRTRSTGRAPPSSTSCWPTRAPPAPRSPPPR